MVKISQGDIFGRIGSGLGQGLSEQIPKEIQHQRLSAGLQQLGNESANLSPTEFLTKAYSTYGITPQMVQSLGEAAKYQRQANAYGGGKRPHPGQGQTGQNQNMPQNQQGQQVGQNQKQPPGKQEIDLNVKSDQAGRPQIQNEPPLDDRTLTRPPWTPQKRDARVNDYLSKGFLVDQARELSSDDESRELAEPAAYQKRLGELEEKSVKANKEFTDLLQKKLQKSGEGVYKDITGKNLAEMERGLERDLRVNPNASYKDVADDWSNRAFELAKAKTQLKKEGATLGIENFWNGRESLKKLKEYSDIFKRSGNSEELFYILQQNTKNPILDASGNEVAPKAEGFGLSPQGSAEIAYPITKSSGEKIGKYKPTPQRKNQYGIEVPPSSLDTENSARKIAIELEDSIDSDDSLLSIARELSLKDPNFDQASFFDQLSGDKDRIRLNDRQRLELAERKPGFTPYWGDILVFPSMRRRK